MFKYVLTDGKLEKTEIESEQTLNDMIKRTYSAPAVQYSFDRYDTAYYYNKRGNKQNSIFSRGLGTKAFTPNTLTKWDNTRKCFVWKDNNQQMEVYDAKNVKITIRGYYFLQFDVDTLPETKNRKSNKRKYVRLNTYLEDLLADSKVWDKKAISDPAIDYTREDRLNEFRAIWAIRQLLTKVFKSNRRISANTLTEMFIKKDYSSEYMNQTYSFGKYVHDIGVELIDYLAAETVEEDGQSGVGRPDSDEGRP